MDNKKRLPRLPAGRQVTFTHCNDYLRKGFTLFELLVSISIIAILTALAIVSYSSAQKKARDSRRIQDISSISKAAEQYYAQANYLYPTSISDWTPPSGTAVLNMTPVDPKNINEYVYIYTPLPDIGTRTGFCVCARMETDGSGNSDTDCAYGGTKNYYCASNQQ